VDLVVDGLLRRDRRRLLEALLLDPIVLDLDLADRLLADYREACPELP
jgi:alpha-galactosidase/6-phospho-beta-glucosidase family protein